MKSFQKKKLIQLSALTILPLLLMACSHALEVKNLDVYFVPATIGQIDKRPTVAILPFSGQMDDMFYFNAIVNRLNMSSNINELFTDYVPMRKDSMKNPPDIVLSIKPTVKYSSSGWNFPINWPGFLIFTPAWNGYVYYADILTHVDIQDGNGNKIQEVDIPISYSIREAEMDRTIFTGLTWLEVSALAFGGGIYNAAVFDRDIISTFQVHVKDNYSTYVTNQLNAKICAVCRSL